ncbi:DUF2622 domain-containing protein [Providencia alcalifaciens]|uniref:hypothetical protein n=1 Tax=Providencia alcalifaciens TaxID=126385 RepID=UPI00056C739D|nr:hypothetical protein [Providencia alcalifaciens]MTC16561.1 DUF2622 domain-containing protein [Providencia alcalifaciens]WGZ53547.1 DUF2622 domain-containing protein [Providencia alcalifaciens]
MPRYTVRIELPNAGYDEYNLLYQKMENSGFDKTIESTNGVIYSLPDAEYIFEGDQDLTTVTTMAVNVATSIRTRAKVLVTESAGRRFHNLDRI